MNFSSNSYSSGYHECLGEEGLHEGKESQTLISSIYLRGRVLNGFLKMCSFLSGSRFSMPLYKSDLLDSGEFLRLCLFATHCDHGLKQWMNGLFYISISTVWCLPRRCAVLCSHRRGECFSFRNAFAMVWLTCWFVLLFCLCEVLWRWTAWSQSFKRAYEKAILTSLRFILTRVCRKA